MTFAEFWPVYVRAHSRPATRVAHLVGTLGGWMLVGAAIAERRWGWVSAAVRIAFWAGRGAHFFLGHKHPPTFLHPPVSWWGGQPMKVLKNDLHNGR